MKKLILVALFLIVLAGCGPKAYVECTATLPGISCSVQRMSGSGGTACWDVVLTCANGKTAKASACHPIPPGEMAKDNKNIPWPEFKGFDECDQVASSGLANMKMK